MENLMYKINLTKCNKTYFSLLIINNKIIISLIFDKSRILQKIEIKDLSIQ